MSTAFSIVTEEFGNALDAIRFLVNAFDDPHKSQPKVRIAAANAATLLLAATFEDFVREMARTYAKAVVAAAGKIERLPPKLRLTAWRRTMESLARTRILTKGASHATDTVFSDAVIRFNVVYEFCKGDLSQDVYTELIHNENNMRVGEINSLFRVSGLGDVCNKVASRTDILTHLGEVEATIAHGRLMAVLDEFIESRNGIAHSLALARSNSPDDILRYADLLGAFGRSLCETLEAVAPAAGTVSEGDQPPADHPTNTK